MPNYQYTSTAGYHRGLGAKRNQAKNGDRRGASGLF